MNNFTKAHNQYLDPPDEPEAEFCEDCGEEMEVKQDSTGDYYAKCTNQYCPGKFEGVAKEMAEMLIGANETVKSLMKQTKNSNPQPWKGRIEVRDLLPPHLT